MFKSLLFDRRGNFALMLAILSPVVMGTVGLAVDFTVFRSQRNTMQIAADQAALAAVREAAMQGWDANTAADVVNSFIATTLSRSAMSYGSYQSEVRVDEEQNRVHVSLRQDGHSFILMGLFNRNPQIEVEAEATLAASANICVLALNGLVDRAVDLKRFSSLIGNGCSVFSNSVSAEGIRISRSRLAANSICSSGGIRAGSFMVTPKPVTDCPQVDDPLAMRTPPMIGPCDHNGFTANSNVTIRPGVYCGGIRLTGNARVIAMPGIYIIKDGEFLIQDHAGLFGKNVGFYLTGNLARTKFANSSTIDLTAPKTGPLAGILVFEDRNSPKGRVFEISSRRAERLIGTIYLPKGRLLVRGSSRFANKSDWTAIIADTVVLENGPRLRLNSDYGSTDIPVPDGVAAYSDPAVLTK